MKTHAIIPAIREIHLCGHGTEVYFSLSAFSYILCNELEFVAVLSDVEIFYL